MNPSRIVTWSPAWIETIEREWIGVSKSGAARIIERARRDGRWRPDPQRPVGSSYCPRCGGAVGPGEWSVAMGCAACRDRRFPWDRMIRLGAYRDPLREWIHAFKFSHWEAMGEALGVILAQAVLELKLHVDAVTPAPTTMRRRFRRGVDHAEILARVVARRLNRPLVHPLRRRPRPPQWTVPVTRRRENVRGAFEPSRIAKLLMPPGSRLVLVDDVTTSRSTVNAVTRALRTAGAGSVTVLVLAAADHRRRRPGAASGDGSPEVDPDELRGV